MSLNRENVSWQSANGTWSIGFFEFRYVNRDSEDFDHEWDVEYDYTEFNWASSGHISAEAAYEAYARNHANPGCGAIYYHPTAEDIEGQDLISQFERRLAAYKEA